MTPNNDPRGALEELIDAEGEYQPGVSRDDALDDGDEDATRLSDVIVGDENDSTNS